MDKQERQAYLEEYKEAKEKGVPFFPDILFKDAVISLVIFLGLIAAAYFIGAPLEEQANPADTSYTPRPEWYFLFLFQLLKYFPGELEVIGVVVLPTLAIILLFLLPFIDSNRLRYFTNRPLITGGTGLMVLVVVVLSILSIQEAPPPSEKFGGDETADLYLANCAACHGPTINVPAGTNLHREIALGSHEGMPAWSADLSTDQIDALAGFILSPVGSIQFNDFCGECHAVSDLVGSDPAILQDSLQLGIDFPAHQDAAIPNWSDVLGQEAQTALLNFLIAPDGQRLFAVNCSSCHGRSIAVSGSESELRSTIATGGLHLEMPGWRDKLSDQDLEDLTVYIISDTGTPQGLDLYLEHCIDCHGNRLPRGKDYDETYNFIAEGGSHETMPIWGDVLTDEQLDALVGYTIEAAQGTPIEVGQNLYIENCESCHGEFGEGGVNPARADDVIAPISTSEYLKTRDDITLNAIISQGQPNFGMSPFGTAFGGPLGEDEVEAIVIFIRSWEANPPVELPPEFVQTTISLSGSEIFANICAQCHGLNADGDVTGPSLRSPAFRENNSSQDIYDTINHGHKATNMIAWGELLTADQIVELVEFVLSLPEVEGSAGDSPSFAASVRPIFESYCDTCHDTETLDGGWDSTTYEGVTTTGENAPVVIPGDVENSLLALKLLGLHTDGDIMPPRAILPDSLIQIILDWILAGAPNN
ncbi:MAG: c-type cytochrome [Anaerolineae bacterium]|nr:c-type cytochrome [Anaerolineae bacterium]